MFLSHHQRRVPVSRVRCVHNVANGPKVNVVLDGKIVLSDVPYKAVSGYLQVPAGQHALAITTTDGAKTLASLRVDLVGGADYTVIAHGDVRNLSSIALLALKDDKSCPARGKSHVRFVHAAATVPNVDIWVNNEFKMFQNVGYGSARSVSILSGTVNVSVTPAGANSVVLGPLPLTLSPGKSYTVIASGLLNNSQAPISVIVSEDSSCYTYHH